MNYAWHRSIEYYERKKSPEGAYDEYHLMNLEEYPESLKKKITLIKYFRSHLLEGKTVELLFSFLILFEWCCLHVHSWCPQDVAHSWWWSNFSDRKFTSTVWIIFLWNDIAGNREWSKWQSRSISKVIRAGSRSFGLFEEMGRKSACVRVSIVQQIRSSTSIHVSILFSSHFFPPMWR